MIRHQVLRATAIPAKFVNEVMANSRSRRQLLFLDCCYSGAFKEGMLAKASEGTGAIEQLQGLGRVVLTASNALQYSFEGDTVHGGGKRSVFTRVLVEGLETGDADLDGDGRFSIDDIYSYICDHLKNEGHAQQPTKIALVEGAVFLGDNPRPKAAKLPDELLEDLSNERPRIRLAAVADLNTLLQGGHKGRARAAYDKLRLLEKDDDSLQVREAAGRHVEQYGAQVERLAREKAVVAESTPEKTPAESALERGGAHLQQPKRLFARRLVIASATILLIVVACLVYLMYQAAPTEAPPPAPTEAPPPATPEAPQANKHAYEYVAAGNALYAKQDYDGAIAKFQQAIALDAKDAEAYRNWGRALNATADYDGAIAKFQQAIALDPKYAAVYNDWGFSLVRRNDNDEAIAKFQQAIALCAKQHAQIFGIDIDRCNSGTVNVAAVAYTNWGRVLDLKQDYDGAITKYRQAIAVDHENAHAYNDWGGACLAKGDRSCAVAEYAKAVQLDPANAKFRRDLDSVQSK